MFEGTLFRFNAKTDLLPYYQNIEVAVDESFTIEDLLLFLKSDAKEFSYENEKIMSVKINNIAVNFDVNLLHFSKTIGKTVKIEPLDSFYSINDLTLKTKSFYEKLELLKEFTDDEDFLFYEKLIDLYYLSPTLKFERDFYGVPFFMLAYFIINKKPKFRKKILSIITNEEHGIWLHTTLNSVLFDNVLAKDIDRVIGKLKRDILKYIPNANSVVKREYKRSQRLYI